MVMRRTRLGRMVSGLDSPGHRGPEPEALRFFKIASTR